MAYVEKQNGEYKLLDLGFYTCGEDFCDKCGDCLSCHNDYCDDGCKWVVYLDNPKNPFRH